MINIVAGLMGLSVLSGVFVFFVKWKSPASNWLDSPNPAKRWFYRTLLFIACLLAPFSISAVAIDLFLKATSLEKAFVSPPLAARLSVLFVPTLLMQWYFARILAKEVRSASAKRSLDS
jgi:hypothetical protein